MKPPRPLLRTCLISLAVALVCAVAAPPASADSSRHQPDIAPIDSRPAGQTYPQWAVDWWQWALENPASQTPFRGAPCHKNQSGRVWYLAGVLEPGTVARTCAVPSGTSLFFPIWSNFYGAFLNDPPATRTARFLFGQVACTADELVVKIDGVAVSDPKRFYVSARQSGLFDIQLPEDNVFGVDETVVQDLRLSPSAQSGYFLFLRPLSTGRHTISWKASGTCFGGTQAQEVTYAIKVAPRHHDHDHD